MYPCEDGTTTEIWSPTGNGFGHHVKAVALLPEWSTMDLAHRCCKALQGAGIPVTAVQLDAKKLKGGYICETLRLIPEYQKGVDSKDFPKSLVLKSEMPTSNDHQVALELHLYDREWDFYENVSHLVPVRVPKYYATLMSSDGSHREGVLMEDLCIPGAVLCPDLDIDGVLLTVEHCAKLHAKFWNDPKLQSSMGISPHNGPWFNPSWRNKVAGHWPGFVAKWKDTLSPEALAAGEKIVKNFQWVQDTISSAPHTFLHGDVKVPNMFMLYGGDGATPAFIDWQYTAIGKGCCDVLFFLVEGYEIDQQREMEPKLIAAYYSFLLKYGVQKYTMEQLEYDWKLATMYFPIYVSMWFGSTADEDLVDPMFPRRFIPRCFDAILRNGSAEIIP